jgi:hypothetical protein
MSLVIQEKYSRYIYATSYISMASSIYGFTRGHHGLATLQFFTFLTSVLYWCKPLYGWRRNLDISAVVITTISHAIKSYNAENGHLFYRFMLCGIISYANSWYHQKCDRMWTATIFHSGVHLFACFSTVALYSGEIPSLLKESASR